MTGSVVVCAATRLKAVARTGRAARSCILELFVGIVNARWVEGVVDFDAWSCERERRRPTGGIWGDLSCPGRESGGFILHQR